MKLLLLIALASYGAIASTLYSTIPSGSNPTETQLSFTNEYSNGAGGDENYSYRQAISFQATGTGIISSLTIDDLYTTSQSSGSLTVEIAEDTGDSPGTIIESFVISNVSGTTANYTALSQMNGQLTAGTVYFLEFLPPSSYPPYTTQLSDDYYTFAVNPSSNTSNFAYFYYTYDGTPQYNSSGPAVLPLLSIDSGPVAPEPQTFALIGFGLGVFLFVQPKRKWTGCKQTSA